MTAERLLTLLFAGCCLFAVVSMAVSLDSTISGTPNDVVDVDTESLPLPADDVEQLKDAVTGPQDREESVSQVSADGEEEGGGDGGDGELAEQREERPAGGGEGDSRQQPAGGAGDASGGGGASDSAAGGAAEEARQAAAEAMQTAQSDGDGGEDSQPTGTTDRLDRLLPVLWLVLALVALGLAYRKRETILERVRALLGLGEQRRASKDETPDPSRPPANEVERRWLEMVAHADDDPAATPRERARAAIETGLAATPVNQLTTLYERVRYGGEPATDRTAAEASSYARQSAGESDD